MSKTDYIDRILYVVAPRADEDVKAELRGALSIFSKHMLKKVSEQGVSPEMASKVVKAAGVFAQMITK